MATPGPTPPAVTVAVVSICGGERLKTCLDALAHQQDAPSFEIVVAYDPSRTEAVRPGGLSDGPGDGVVWIPSSTSPPELAAAAVRVARGSVVLLTEDHCVAHPDWIHQLYAAIRRGGDAPRAGAAGGPVALAPGCRSGLEWAFHYSDFAGFIPPVRGGPSRSLSACNAAYSRATLEQVRATWSDAFHETRVHAAIRQRVGPLMVVPEAVVVSGRRVQFLDALRERYAFGRLYGALLMSSTPLIRRGLRAAVTPLLPPLLLGRIARRASRSPETRRGFLRGLPHLVPLLLAWSCGEGVGVLTGHGPTTLKVAPEPAPASVTGTGPV